MNSKLISALGIIGVIVCGFGLSINLHYSNRYISLHDSPGSNELLDGAAMGLMTGLFAMVIVILIGWILGSLGNRRMGYSIVVLSVLLSAISIGRYWYVVSI